VRRVLTHLTHFANAPSQLFLVSPLSTPHSLLQPSSVPFSPLPHPLPPLLLQHVRRRDHRLLPLSLHQGDHSDPYQLPHLGTRDRTETHVSRTTEVREWQGREAHSATHAHQGSGHHHEGGRWQRSEVRIVLLPLLLCFPHLGADREREESTGGMGGEG
jgi:hypothetical protein